MSEYDKQEIINRLFQGHEIRIRVLEKIEAKVDRLDEKIDSLRRGSWLLTGAFGILVGAIFGGFV
ncbi:hypothetical protein [Thioalkalivibrio sp. HK1]|uniref:hypothetical protein n=1 Tax=Thioalkalivibrio sp. HK1 TaxID=1469245 RepID=UPI000472CD95|nr:hypothetical protein [Thioalkalivibrio sp. HK1]